LKAPDLVGHPTTKPKRNYQVRIRILILNHVSASNLNWLHVLGNDYHKQILPEAVKHRVDKNEVTIYAFVPDCYS